MHECHYHPTIPDSILSYFTVFFSFFPVFVWNEMKWILTKSFREFKCPFKCSMDGDYDHDRSAVILFYFFSLSLFSYNSSSYSYNTKQQQLVFYCHLKISYYIHKHHIAPSRTSTDIRFNLIQYASSSNEDNSTTTTT